MYSNRRQFISSSLAIGAAASLSGIVQQAHAQRTIGPNDTIQVGVIGPGGMGSGHVKKLLGMSGVKLVALCDVDAERMASAVAEAKKKGITPKTYSDMRQLLDDSDVDAVVIATPNHWHALATIWACQAGKDVYVEKPVTHNLWEGERVIAAARKYNRVVQAGTQNRSDTGFREAIQFIREGNIGAIQWVHGLWYKKRDSIGKVTGPQTIPPTINYDLWTGPAPLKPLMREKLHYDWHWNWDTGNADMGNLGAHQLDDCAHILDAKALPKRFACLGGRFALNDDGETPNVQMTFMEFENLPPVIVEVRGLSKASGSKEMDVYRGLGQQAGNVVQCENGYFAGGRGGGSVFDNKGKVIKAFPGDSGGTHMQNWIDAIRSRDSSSLRAEIEIGVLSANLCHLANLSYRSGEPTAVEETLKRIGTTEHNTEAVESVVSHLKANGVDLSKPTMNCSAWMQYDAAKMELTGGSEDANATANALVKRSYRAPFVVPESI